MSAPRRQMIYSPKRLTGQSVEELRTEMQQELDRMAMTLKQLTDQSYFPQAQEPERFSEGSMCFFTGGISVTGIAVTIAGLHQFRNGEWHRLTEDAS